MASPEVATTAVAAKCLSKAPVMVICEDQWLSNLIYIVADGDSCSLLYLGFNVKKWHIVASCMIFVAFISLVNIGEHPSNMSQFNVYMIFVHL